MAHDHARHACPSRTAATQRAQVAEGRGRFRLNYSVVPMLARCQNRRRQPSRSIYATGSTMTTIYHQRPASGTGNWQSCK